nr:MAG TPA: hypothetical protein [Herelleviridae sp.]
MLCGIRTLSRTIGSPASLLLTVKFSFQSLVALRFH